MNGWSNWDSGWITQEQVLKELAAAFIERTGDSYYYSGWQTISSFFYHLRLDISSQLDGEIYGWYIKPADFTANCRTDEDNVFPRLTAADLSRLLGYEISLESIEDIRNDAEFMRYAKQFRDILNLMTMKRLQLSLGTHLQQLTEWYETEEDAGFPTYTSAAFLQQWNAEPLEESTSASRYCMLQVNGRKTNDYMDVSGRFYKSTIIKPATPCGGTAYFYSRLSSSSYNEHAWQSVLPGVTFDIVNFREYSLVKTANTDAAEQEIELISESAKLSAPPLNWFDTSMKAYGFELSNKRFLFIDYAGPGGFLFK